MPVAARIALGLLDRRVTGALLALACAIPLFVVLLLMSALGGLAGSRQTQTPAAPSASALNDIPPAYLKLYRAAAQAYGLDWAILAGIGKVECDHGRAPYPSCTVTGDVNADGAGGPMQFIQATWALYGVNPAGRHVPDSDRWNATDAIYSAANYLVAAGAPQDYPQAIFAYNHADWYVSEVLAWAATYSAPDEPTVPLAETVPGATARITPQGYALAPTGAPAAVQQMIAAGNQIIHFPYVYAGGHSDATSSLSLQNAQPDGGGYDCSSAVSYVLHGAGLLDEPEASGQLESFGEPGPGRWVTVFANSGHTFMLVAGVVMNTVWETAVQPAIPPSGPRWQPAFTVTTQILGDRYGGFLERHPAGL